MDGRARLGRKGDLSLRSLCLNRSRTADSAGASRSGKNCRKKTRQRRLLPFDASLLHFERRSSHIRQQQRLYGRCTLSVRNCRIHRSRSFFEQPRKAKAPAARTSRFSTTFRNLFLHYGDQQACQSRVDLLQESLGRPSSPPVYYKHSNCLARRRQSYRTAQVYSVRYRWLDPTSCGLHHWPARNSKGTASSGHPCHPAIIDRCGSCGQPKGAYLASRHL